MADRKRIEIRPIHSGRVNIVTPLDESSAHDAAIKCSKNKKKPPDVIGFPLTVSGRQS